MFYCSIPRGILLIISTGNLLCKAQPLFMKIRPIFQRYRLIELCVVCLAMCRHRRLQMRQRISGNQSNACMCIIKKKKKTVLQRKASINLHISSGSPSAWFVSLTNGLFFLYFFLFLFDYVQINDLRPATTYMFIVRAENSYGLSIPSPVSGVIKTSDTDKSIMPPNELVAARAFLSGKVSFCLKVSFFFSASGSS